MRLFTKNGFRALVLLMAVSLWVSSYAGVTSSAADPQGAQFIKNKGQWDSRIKYLLPFSYGRLYIENGRVTFTLYSEEKDSSNHLHPHVGKPKTGFVYRINYLGSSPQAVIAGDAAYSYHNNYYIGRNRSKWASDVPIYAQSTYKGLYNGIDLTYKGNNDLLEYMFTIQPGADPSQIRMAYDTVLKNLRIVDNVLEYSTSVTDVAEVQLNAYQYTAPNVYQAQATTRIQVKCNYKLEGNIVSFTFPDGYDSTLPLIIDPTLIYSTFTGSTMDNFGFTATYDNEGNGFMGGIAVNGALEGYPADTVGYPVTSGAFQLQFGGGECDDAITKVNGNGTSRMYATFLGGSGSETPNSMVVNNNNELLVFGVTSSPDFPVTNNAFDTTFHGGIPDSLPDNGAYFESGTDIYITKFDSAGHMLASTLYGGSGNDGLNWTGFPDYEADVDNAQLLAFNYSDAFRGEIEVDSANNVYVASCTSSPSLYPKIGSSIRDQLNGPEDGIVFKMNPDLTSLVWQTYVGGSSYDALYSLDIDSKGNVYAGGGTMSSDFATTNKAINTTEPGGRDGILIEIAANGSSIKAATYIGTPQYDQVFFVKLGPDSNVYITGQTLGTYPVTAGVYNNPSSTQFIHCLTPSLDTTVFSTVFGTGDPNHVNMCPTAFLVDECGLIYVCGWGGTVNNSGLVDYYGNVYDFTFYGNDSTSDVAGMPIDSASAIETNSNGSDFYLIVLNYRASSFVYGTYIGSDSTYSVSHVDGGTSRFDKRGVIYEAVCASCFNTGFFSTPGVVAMGDSSFNCNEALVKFSTQLSPVIVQVSASPSTTGCIPFNMNFNARGVNVVNYSWNFGDSTTSTQPNPSHQYTTPGTYNVTLVGANPNICPAKAVTDTSRLTVVVKGILTASQIPKDSGCEPLPYSYTPVVTGATSAAVYTWNFGDGTPVSNQLAGNHLYDTSGTFTAYFTITDTNDCNTIHDSVNVIVVYNVLQAAFTDSILKNVCDTLQVGLTNKSVGASSISWTLGDGDTSSANSLTHAYNQAGTYQIQLIASQPSGCKLHDTATTTVTLKPVLKAADLTPDTTGCPPLLVTFTSRDSGTAALNYSWNFGDGSPVVNTPSATHTFSNSGTYLVILTSNDTGTCNVNIVDTSVVQVPIDSLKAAFTVQVNKDVCDTLQVSAYNQSQYATSITWYYGNGNTSASDSISYVYNTAGTYNIQLVASRPTGCKLLDTANQIVTLKPKLKAAILSPDTTGCPPLNLTLSSVDSGTATLNYSWNFGDGTVVTNVQDPTHTFDSSGTYQVILTANDTGTCNVHIIDTVGVVVLIDSLKAAFDLHINKDVCDTLQIAAINQSQYADSFVWYYGNNIISNNDSISYMYNTPGSYPVQLIAFRPTGCRRVDTVTQTVALKPQLFATVSSPDTVGCFPLLASFFVRDSGESAALIYLWNFGDGSTSSSNKPTHTFENPGTYQVILTATDTGTCNITVVDTLNVLARADSLKPGFTLNVLRNVCDTLNIQLTDESVNAAAISWSFGDGDTSSASSPGHSYHTPGTYTIIQTVTGKYCRSLDTSAQSVTLLPRVLALFTPQNGCLPYSYTPANNSTNAVSYLWKFQGTTSTENGPIISFDSIGTYNLSLTAYNPNSCNDSNSYSASVNVYPLPKAGFVTDSTHYDVFSDVTFINKSSHPASYTWTFGDGTTSNDADPVHQYQTDGTVIPCLNVVDSNQCEAEICDTIDINFVGVVDVPSAFSPNGDGQNDILYVKGYGVTELDFRIYNRWGELVFQSTSMTDGWDGMFRGSAQAMDVYTYTLQATFRNGVQTPLRKGNITLLR